MKRTAVLALFLVTTGLQQEHDQEHRDYPIRPVPFTQVEILDGFWLPRLETNRKVTIPYSFQKCEETGRISNFAKAGGLEQGKFEGIYFNDSDVFKVIEGASYSLQLHPDPKLESYLDEVIAKIAAAQEEDGYLYSNRTIDPDEASDGAGNKRWTNLKVFHELYNVGHLYEAAVAHHQATGKRTLLDVALRNADLVAEVFGPDKNTGVPGHVEIEIGLVKLYRETGKAKYLELSKFFIDQRGNSQGHTLYGEYAQDHEPVLRQDEAVGHAVRAGYLYSGVADIAALTGESAYTEAIDRIWNNVVSKKLYITGGIGARRRGEAFGDNYELPNATAYNETCAAIANMLWNHRLFLLKGESKYLDVLERTLYNGFLAGISLKGDTFFYPNPLSADGVFTFNQGAVERKPWFDCSCCPVNIVRMIPSLPGYIYAVKDQAVYVNLFINSRANVDVDGEILVIEQKSEHPWEGRIRFTLNPPSALDLTLRIRLPGWARNEVVPSDLYRYSQAAEPGIQILVNAEETNFELDKGYAVLQRTWKKGDMIQLSLPMPIRKVLGNDLVEATRGRLAIERGPLVYCAEGIDNRGSALNLLLEKEAELKLEAAGDILGGLSVIRGSARVKGPVTQDADQWRTQPMMAIPYYAWAHRGAGEMTVWFPYVAEAFTSPEGD
jgi:DUF1680 family protein